MSRQRKTADIIMKKLWLATMLAFFFLFFIPVIAFSQIKITFQVIDLDSGLPIEEAYADYYGYNLVTNEAGFAEFELSHEQCVKLGISENKDKRGNYKMDFPDFLKSNYRLSTVNSKTIQDTTLVYFVQVVPKSVNFDNLDNYSSSEKFKIGVDMCDKGELLQTTGFVISVAGPIIESGIFYLSANTNYKAMAGVELATVGLGVVLYCIGTVKKAKGRTMIKASASGIQFNF